MYITIYTTNLIIHKIFVYKTNNYISKTIYLSQPKKANNILFFNMEHSTNKKGYHFLYFYIKQKQREISSSKLGSTPRENTCRS